VILTETEQHLAERLHEVLGEELAVRGLLGDPHWRAAFDRVPRHVLVPEFYEHDGAGGWRWVGSAEPSLREHWLRSVYADQTLVIALTEVALPEEAGGGTFQEWTSSSTLPSLVLSMLQDLRLSEAHRVLEIGTGSAYNAGLLCARLGDRQVASIDVDPGLVHAATGRLKELGFAPYLRAGDGSLGLPEWAPVDRIVSTCSVRAIPLAWLEQTRNGGVILTDLRGQIGGNLVRLTKQDDGTAIGRFLPEQASFMWLRHTQQPIDPLLAPGAGDGGVPVRRASVVDPSLLIEDPRFAFVAQLHLPGGRLTQTTRIEDGQPAVRITLPDGSWCETGRRADPYGRFDVTECGAQPVWKLVEDGFAVWRELGRPSWDQFGVTVAQGGQTVWHQSGHSRYRWSLPDPDRPSPTER
jgi:methyltransferase of ATP-grasp peptide maturase system